MPAAGGTRKSKWLLYRLSPRYFFNHVFNSVSAYISDIIDAVHFNNADEREMYNLVGFTLDNSINVSSIDLSFVPNTGALYCIASLLIVVSVYEFQVCAKILKSI